MVDVKRWEVPVPVELFKIIDRQLQAGCKRVGNTLFERRVQVQVRKGGKIQKSNHSLSIQSIFVSFAGNDRLRFFFR